ncbi:hypothetical protein DE146DRAFT_462963 [Phaeosphaeria sp. MPI-PUGE-AT-0046c]|nr:hypothetical protein DE146DRAFT_462963 [Phaeosphaeria sp. MPI-PUGE-AT-0046c]
MAVDEELPWTTSRCNRLLRPISSKLAKLRAEVERPRSAGAETRAPSSAFATKGSPHKTTNFTRPALRPRGFEKAADPDWKPTAKAGRGSKKTYGGRGAKKAVASQRAALEVSHPARPGEIAFTPLVARISGHQLQSSPYAPHSPLKKYGKNKGPLQVNIDWTQLPGDLRNLVQGICEAYANLLQATTSEGQKSWKGTRTMMGACLRQLPVYIELEEHFAKLDREEEEDGDEARDISNEVYGHLEAHFEQRPGLGWRFLKQVVRAHATSLICNAISDEIIALDSLSMLVAHCTRASAWDEAERLLLAYLPRLDSPSFPTTVKADLFDAQKSPYLHAIKNFVDHTGRHRLLFDLLEHMIAHELLPLEWLATECLRPVWDRLVRSITGDDHRTIAHAHQLFNTVIMTGQGLPDERLLANETTGARHFVPSSRDDLRAALNTTYSSLFTVLCSITLVNNGSDDQTGKGIARRVTWMLDAAVIATLQRNDVQSEMLLLEAHPEDSQKFLQRAVWLLFASCLIHLDNCAFESSVVRLRVPDLLRGINWLVTQYSLGDVHVATVLGSLPALISSVAQGTGRIWKDDGSEQLQRLLQPLMSLSGYRLPHRQWTLKRLALESAMEFSQTTGMAEHMAYTRVIEQKMRTQGQLIIAPSPQKHDSPASGGFKWEEGIGEWVACTPFARQSVKSLGHKPLQVLNLLPTPSQSEDEDPLPTGDFLEDDVPMSSPIKRVSRSSTSSLGKRTRASSPMVVVPVKRSCSASSSQITFYAELPNGREAEYAASSSRLRTQQRKVYKEQALGEDGRDDLGLTSARPVAKRRTSRRHVVQPRTQWWRVPDNSVGASDVDGSEDELSFH